MTNEWLRQRMTVGELEKKNLVSEERLGPDPRN